MNWFLSTGSSWLKVSRIGIISKEGEERAKNWATETAKLLLDEGMDVASFPNLSMKEVTHAASVSEFARMRFDIVITFSGDGTILSLLRSLDSTVPCLCVNVGGRGILAEIKPDQVIGSIHKIVRGDFHLESRIRVAPSIGSTQLPPALNEVVLVRKSFAKTPTFEMDLQDGASYTRRMDGIILSTPTGSTGHSFSYGSPFLEGTMRVFALTPLAPIYRFPPMVVEPTIIKVRADLALQLVIDGQETFSVKKGTEVSFRKHSRDAVFIRLSKAGSYRQLSNFLSLERNSYADSRKV